MTYGGKKGKKLLIREREKKGGKQVTCRGRQQGVAPK